MLCPLRLDIDDIDVDGSPWLIDETFVKTHVRIDDTDQDVNLQSYIKAAILWAENFTHRTLVQRTHRWVLSEFPSSARQSIRLPRGKTVSVASVAYSISGAVTTLSGPTSTPPGSGYQEDLRGDGGGVLMPVRGGTWPSVDYDVPAPIMITFSAGWAPEDIPADLLNGVLMAIADSYDIRGTGDANAAKLEMSGPRLAARESLISGYMMPRWY